MKNQNIIGSYRTSVTAAIKMMMVFTLLMFTSCSKELEEKPKSLAVETFYNTAAEVEAAVNAIYVPYIQTGEGLALFLAQVESYVDYGFGRGSYAILNDFAGLDPTNITRTQSMWGMLYLSIRNANLVIANAPNGSSISQADIDRFVGEAKFLRAFDYFFLVRNWSGVPIRTEANMTERDLKRSTADEVYALIQADLLDAENKLPENPTQGGRPSKWAAKTLLAHVYLQLGKNSEARDKANEVILSNKYSLVPVTTVDDWQKIFGPDVVRTTEEIFYVKCARQAGFGNYYPMFTNHPGTGFHGAGGFFAQYSDKTNAVYAGQSDADLRKGLWYSWNIGLGSNSILNKKFIDPTASGNLGAGNDQPWYRYADLLLIYAEAASRAANGPTPEAMEALNKVHRRAYGKLPTVPSDVDFNIADYNATTFIDLIIKERGYEFQYEGKRWLELKRTGKAAEIIQAVKGKTIADKFYLWPIPVSEMNYNKALDPVADQNPGY
ncbi:RagB/SusD family nutrient uptake outer membrane protein [Pollutibacter soli]|uniref:RagB/SusD family nutrient uptake outer membrane protein n=1 Tax=Pollutibacter soli TaxID=3034157 RepID=UPI0030138F59